MKQSSVKSARATIGRFGEVGWFLPAGLLLLVVVCYPVARTIELSFVHENLANGFHAEFAGLENFRRILIDSRFRNSLTVTGLFTIVSVALEFLVGLLLAVSVDTLRRSRHAARVIFLVPWTLPTAVIAVLWAWIFNDQFGALNMLLMRTGLIGAPIPWLGRPDTAMGAMIVADVWKTTPFVFLILLAGLQNVPRDLYEAIEIDGGGPWVKFRRVTWPHLLPFAFAAVIFRAVQAFAIFDLVWVMTGGGPAGSTETISVYTYQTYMRYLDFGYGSALAIVTVLILAGVAAVLYRALITRYERTF
ncbi:MAG TPA: sugar ABC transporter permease [Terriglobia bacterium]|nr:sugar ABC transporter permease [Terriglobia bacterium]